MPMESLWEDSGATRSFGPNNGVDPDSLPPSRAVDASCSMLRSLASVSGGSLTPWAPDSPGRRHAIRGALAPASGCVLRPPASLCGVLCRASSSTSSHPSRLGRRGRLTTADTDRFRCSYYRPIVHLHGRPLRLRIPAQQWGHERQPRVGHEQDPHPDQHHSGS